MNIDEEAKSRNLRKADGPEEKEVVEKVADHYNKRTNQTHLEREASPIIYLKKLNNWVKSVLIKKYSSKGCHVLDLACGKGGDLTKWDKQEVAYYVGVDIALGSVDDARVRYNGEASHNKREAFKFPARFIHADCFGVSLTPTLKNDFPFDIVSCQFAFHYSFQSEERVRQGLKNVSEALRPGGYFIGTIPDANVIVKKLRSSDDLTFGSKVHSLSFSSKHRGKRFRKASPFGIEYNFHLEDAVDCPEWLVPFQIFESLCLEYDLVLESKANFHEFTHDNITSRDFALLMKTIVGFDWDQKISSDEWDAAYLYLTFAFKKKGDKKVERKKVLPHPKKVDEEDIISIQA